MTCIGPARADWLWFDDSRPTALRTEANGFTLSPLLVAGSALTDGTYDNRERVLPDVTDVSFSGTFSLYYAAASTFAWRLFFLPPGGATAPTAELVMNGVPEDGGEHVAGTFLGMGDPALPGKVPVDAEAIVVNPDLTFPFHTQNLSMLISIPMAPATVGEPTGIGALSAGILVLWAASGANCDRRSLLDVSGRRRRG